MKFCKICIGYWNDICNSQHTNINFLLRFPLYWSNMHLKQEVTSTMLKILKLKLLYWICENKQSVKNLQFNINILGDPNITYNHWNPDQGPNQSGFIFASGSHEDCALMKIHDGFRWYDYECSLFLYHYSFICQHGNKVLRMFFFFTKCLLAKIIASKLTINADSTK